MPTLAVGSLSPEELRHLVVKGGRLVEYEFCISLVVGSLRRTSGVRLLKPGELGLVRGLPFTILSFLLGWWGIPWGIIYTPLAIITNCAGGRDVTGAFLARLGNSQNPGSA
jgi:hypothetical protein